MSAFHPKRRGGGFGESQPTPLELPSRPVLDLLGRISGTVCITDPLPFPVHTFHSTISLPSVGCQSIGSSVDRFVTPSVLRPPTDTILFEDVTLARPRRVDPKPRASARVSTVVEPRRDEETDQDLFRPKCLIFSHPRVLVDQLDSRRSAKSLYNAFPSGFRRDSTVRSSLST